MAFAYCEKCTLAMEAPTLPQALANNHRCWHCGWPRHPTPEDVEAAANELIDNLTARLEKLEQTNEEKNQ